MNVYVWSAEEMNLCISIGLSINLEGFGALIQEKHAEYPNILNFFWNLVFFELSENFHHFWVRLEIMHQSVIH